MNFYKNLSVSALAVIIVAGNVTAQVKKKPVTAHKPLHTASQTAGSNLLPVDPNVIIGKLPNGLTPSA